MLLYRPTGLAELKLVASLEWAAWPARLPEQPIFYPVLSLEYARRIARDWNTKDEFSGYVGFVTSFELENEFSKRYPVQQAGGDSHEELWVPASELEEFNRHIVGPIDVLEAYPGPRFTSAIDAETKVPPELSASYRSSRVRGKVTVRAARVSDAASVVSLLVDSITKLCVDDHRGDPATLERWLQNKTVAHFQHWLADGSSFIVVAELGSKLCGVALLNRETVQLCYVLPGLQGIGVGRALMHALESEALRRGVRRVSLMSSGSARRFYERLGYVAGGEGGVAFGVLRQYPYTKAL